MITVDTFHSAQPDQIGTKATQLFRLQKIGIRVPELVALTCHEVAEVIHSQEVAEDLLAQIYRSLPEGLYAVRSAVLDEDGVHSANAGAYSTKLSVHRDDIAQAILSVANDASLKRGLMSGISIICQSYIEAEYGGVCFTRHPSGLYSRLIEYQAGSAEQVVHGAAVETVDVPIGQKPKTALVCFDELLTVSETIEQFYDGPQDIEWVYAKGLLYIVQSRPITTLSSGQFLAQKELDAVLPTSDEYFFTTAPAAETFKNPTPLAFSVLELLHEVTGPVERSYAALGIRYSPKQEHVQFGAAVYVDKYKELHTLLPAYTWKGNQKKLQWHNVKKVLTTMNNIWKLERIPVSKLVPELQKKTQELLDQRMSDVVTLKDAKSQLIDTYETIFTISLCTQKSVKDLERFLGPTGRQHLATFLTPTRELEYNDVEFDGLIGNSLNIDDRSEFVQENMVPDDLLLNAVDTWLQSQPGWKQHALKEKITTAQKYIELREAGRVVSVHLISQLRKSIQVLAKTHQIKDVSLLSFATLDELPDATYDQTLWEQRRNTYIKQVSYSFPPIISTYVIEQPKGVSYGVSGGVALGTVVTTQTIGRSTDKEVLVVDMLSPEVVQYFPQIVGLVSKTGGLLSHAAIMAREASLPVVVDSSHALTPGDQIQVDGNAGTVTMF